MRIRIIPVVGLVMLASACASASRDPVIDVAASPPPTVTGTGSGTEIRYDRDTHVAEGPVLADLSVVWQALPKALADLRVPVGEVDPGAHTVHSGFFKAPRQMATKQLSDFLDCGYSLEGPRVRLWEVNMDVLSAVRADGQGKSRLATTITASARPRDGTSTSPVPCNTKGELEKLILEQVRERSRT
jgi:hypothetical protein